MQEGKHVMSGSPFNLRNLLYVINLRNLLYVISGTRVLIEGLYKFRKTVHHYIKKFQAGYTPSLFVTLNS